MKKKIAKIFLGVFLALFLFLILIVLGIHVSLKSRSMTAMVVPKIEETLKTMGIDAKIGPLSLNLFGDIDIENTKVSMAKENLSLVASLDQIRIQYSLWPLITKSQLEISSIEVNRPTLDLIISGLSSSPAEQPPKVDGSPLDAEQMLMDLKEKLDLNSIKINRASIHVKVKDKSQLDLDLWIDPLNFATNLHVASGVVALGYELDLKNQESTPIHLAVDKAADKLKMDAKLGFAFASQGRFSFDLRGEKAILVVEDGKTDMSISDVEVGLTKDLQRVFVSFAKFEVGLTDVAGAESTTKTFELTKSPMNMIEAIKADLAVKVGVHNFKASVAAHKKQPIYLSLSEKKVNLSVGIDHKKVDIHLASSGSEIVLPELIDPIAFDLKADALLSDVFSNIDRKEMVKGQLQFGIGPIKVKQLDGPIRLSLKTDLNADLNQKDYVANVALALNEHPIFATELKASDKEKVLTLVGDIDLASGSFLIPIKKQLAALEKVGGFSVKTSVDLKLNHPFLSMENFDPKKIDALGAKLHLITQINQIEAAKIKEGVVIKGPITIDNTVSFKKKRLDHKLVFKLPEAGLGSEASAKDMSLVVNTVVLDPQKMKDAQLDLKMKIARIFAKKLAEMKDLKPLLGDISLSLRASLKQLSEFSLKSFDFRVGNDIVSLSSLAEGSAKKKNAQTSGELKFDFGKLGKLAMLEKTSGSIEAMWDLTTQKATKFSASSKLGFKDVSLKGPNFRLDGVRGAVTLFEEVNLQKGNRFGFEYLLEKDAFQRVDFELVSPYIKDQDRFSIDKIGVGDWVIGPLEANFAIEQNIVMAPIFELGLLGGSLAGEFYLDVHPRQMKVSVKGIMTHLDASQLVTKGKAAKDKRKSEDSLSGSMAIEVDLNRSLLEGQINITEISEYQLVQLLNVIDPDYEDKRIAKLRTALQLGSPQSVEVAMKYGLMNVKVVIKSAVNTTVEVTGIELSRFVSANTVAVKKMIEQIPIN